MLPSAFPFLLFLCLNNLIRQRPNEIEICHTFTSENEVSHKTVRIIFIIGECEMHTEH